MMKKKAIDFKNQTPSGINYNQLFVVKKTEKDEHKLQPTFCCEKDRKR